LLDDPLLPLVRLLQQIAIYLTFVQWGTTNFCVTLLSGMPINVLPVEVIQQITAGGAQACLDAGIVIAGGHSIDTVETNLWD
jgi:selenide,water dikinase